MAGPVVCDIAYADAVVVDGLASLSGMTAHETRGRIGLLAGVAAKRERLPAWEFGLDRFGMRDNLAPPGACDE